MPLVKSIEQRIQDIEGFRVIIRYADRDVRSDAILPKQYASQRMTRNSFTVNDFKRKFQEQYPGYDIDVLKSDGSKAVGQMKLSTVRETYK